MPIEMQSMLFSEKRLDEFIEEINEYSWFDDELTDEEWEELYGDKSAIDNNLFVDTRMAEDSVVALQALGYKKKDAERYMKEAFQEGAHTVEEVIKYALKQAQKEKRIPC